MLINKTGCNLVWNFQRILVSQPHKYQNISVYNIDYVPIILSPSNHIAPENNASKNDNIYVIRQPKNHMDIICVANHVMVDMIALY